MLAVLAFYQGDKDQAERLSQWILDLGGAKGHTLLLVRDKDVSGDEQLQANFRQAFDEVTIIEPLPDAYRSWPASANAAFQFAARYIENNKLAPYWFWIESDLAPLVPGWLGKIEADHLRARKPFTAADVNVPGIERHASGIAVYPQQMTKYAGLALIAHETAWDITAAQQILPNTNFTPLIAHSWDRDTEAKLRNRTARFENYEQVEREVFQPHPQAVVYHADKTDSLIRLLREKRKEESASLISNRTTESSTPQSCDIFIKSTPKDYEWLSYCRRSIDKFATGFGKVILVIPKSEEGSPESIGLYVNGVIDDWMPGNHKIQIKAIEVPEYGEDHYLSQQVFKMHAGTFSDADYFLYIDSDTIFTKPVTPETFFKDGKPIWLMTPWQDAGDLPWKAIMQKFMGREPPFEFMRRMGQVIPRWLLIKFREFCEEKHGMTLDKYIMSQPSRSFSEFNVIAFYAYEFHRDKFTWIDTSKVPESEWPELVVDQRWSHNPIPKEEWEVILGGTVKQAEKITIPHNRPADVPSNPFLTKENVYGSEELRKQLENYPGEFEMREGNGGGFFDETWVRKPKLAPPWKNRKESEKEVALLCEALALFAQAPAYKKRVRDALRRVKIIN